MHQAHLEHILFDSKINQIKERWDYQEIYFKNELLIHIKMLI